jgi:hypothetical protein
MIFNLRFDKKEIPYWAKRYPTVEDEKVEKDIAPLIYSGYTLFCRQLAPETVSTMRVIGRALWQYSDENQPGGRK